MPSNKNYTSEQIEDRASAMIEKLTEIKKNFDGNSTTLVYQYNAINDEATRIKKELMEKIYTLSDQISSGMDLHEDQIEIFREESVTQTERLIAETKRRQERMQDERICRRISLVMLHANMTNTLNDIESLLFFEMTAINQMDNTALALQC